MISSLFGFLYLSILAKTRNSVKQILLAKRSLCLCFLWLFVLWLTWPLSVCSVCMLFVRFLSLSCCTLLRTTHSHSVFLQPAHFQSYSKILQVRLLQVRPVPKRNSWKLLWQKFKFYRPHALPVAQPTASKHWRMNFVGNKLHINKKWEEDCTKDCRDGS